MAKQPDQPVTLDGCRILVLEDEYFLADDIVRELKKLGARIVGPLGNIEEACNLVEGDVAIDAAVLDINLRNEMVFPLARTLRTRHVPFVFTSGYDRSALDPEFHDAILWEKPLDIVAMARELAGLIQSCAGRARSAG
jgi:CheY-like chemotaxis protein